MTPRCKDRSETWFASLPTLTEIAVNLGAAIAAIWIGGAVVIGGVDRLRAHLRHHRPAVHRNAHVGFHPGPAQDL